MAARQITAVMSDCHRRVIRNAGIDDLIDMVTDPRVRFVRDMTDPKVMRFVDDVRQISGPAGLRDLPSGRGLGGL